MGFFDSMGLTTEMNDVGQIKNQLFNARKKLVTRQNSPDLKKRQIAETQLHAVNEIDYILDNIDGERRSLSDLMQVIGFAVDAGSFDQNFRDALLNAVNGYTADIDSINSYLSNANVEVYKLFINFLYDNGNTAFAQVLGFYAMDSDPDKALEYFRISEEAGQLSIPNIYNTGLIYFEKSKYDIAFSYIKKAADNNYSEALNMLGLFYENGYSPVQCDLNKALELFKKAMDLGSKAAPNNYNRLMQGNNSNGNLPAAANNNLPAAQITVPPEVNAILKANKVNVENDNAFVLSCKIAILRKTYNDAASKERGFVNRKYLTDDEFVKNNISQNTKQIGFWHKLTFACLICYITGSLITRILLAFFGGITALFDSTADLSFVSGVGQFVGIVGFVIGWKLSKTVYAKIDEHKSAKEVKKRLPDYRAQREAYEKALPDHQRKYKVFSDNAQILTNYLNEITKMSRETLPEIYWDYGGEFLFLYDSRRAENVREAVNVWENILHQERMEQEQRRQGVIIDQANTLAQEAHEYARRALNSR